MKKLSLYLFLILMISNVSLANSTLFDQKRRADTGDAVAQNTLGHFIMPTHSSLLDEPRLLTKLKAFYDHLKKMMAR